MIHKVRAQTIALPAFVLAVRIACAVGIFNIAVVLLTSITLANSLRIVNIILGAIVLVVMASRLWAFKEMSQSRAFHWMATGMLVATGVIGSVQSLIVMRPATTTIALVTWCYIWVLVAMRYAETYDRAEPVSFVHGNNAPSE